MAVLLKLDSIELQMLISILSWAGNKPVDMNEEASTTVRRVYEQLVEEGQLMGDLL